MNAMTEQASLDTHESMNTIYNKVFAAIEGTVKNAENPHFKNKFANLNAVITAIKQPLVDLDCSYLQRSKINADGITIETILIHGPSGGSISLGEMSFPAVKRDPQAFAAASTYLRRHALCVAFNLAVFDDDLALAAANGKTIESKALPELEEAALHGKVALRAKLDEIKERGDRDLVSIWAANKTSLLETAAENEPKGAGNE